MTTFDIDRATGIGASEAPAVLGLDRYRTAADVWATKTGAVAEEPPNMAMRLGHLLEPVVADLYTERTGIRIRKRRGAVYDPVHPFLYAHLDRWNGERVVEIKTSSHPSEEWGPDGSSDIPVGVMVQTMLQMRYAHRAQADVVALLWGRELRVYPLAYDADLADQLVERLVQFWNDYVIPDVQPPVDGSDAAREFLRKRYPTDNGEELVATPGNLGLITRLLAARADTERAKAEQQEAENQVKELMGSASTLLYPSGKVTWRAQTIHRTDWERVAGHLADELRQRDLLTVERWTDLVESYRSTLPSRVFRVSSSSPPDAPQASEPRNEG